MTGHGRGGAQGALPLRGAPPPVADQGMRESPQRPETAAGETYNMSAASRSTKKAEDGTLRRKDAPHEQFVKTGRHTWLIR